MAIIIETCPKCGHDLMDVILPTNPPIPKKECCGCGWSWTGTREQVLRVPFGGNSFYIDGTYELHGNTDYEIVKAPHDDSSCTLNNINGYAFTVNQNDLDILTNASKFTYDDIAQAVERTKQYIKEG